MNEKNSTIIRCPSCGAGNRIPAERMGTPAKCGKCHAELPGGNGQAAYKMRCTECGTKNKIPAAKIKAGPKCGKCGSQLQTGELFKPQPVMVTEANFDSEILKSPLPVLMFAWAPW
jgi:thioredoxin 2